MLENKDDQTVVEEFEIFWRTINKGICPQCKQSMIREQVGPCVYAKPCNHRLYQGKI